MSDRLRILLERKIIKAINDGLLECRIYPMILWLRDRGIDITYKDKHPDALWLRHLRYNIKYEVPT